MDKELGGNMKKRNNKIIVLVLFGIVFAVSLVIFILNYTKDDSSFSILEKKWINDNKSNVIDVSVYNDVPVYGKNGSGVIFDFLNDFTDTYGINFNKVSYLTSSNNSSMKDISFRILGSNNNLSENDILLYTDEYVLVSKTDNSLDRISDIVDMNIGVLSSDISLATIYLQDAKNVKFTPKKDTEELMNALEEDEIEYILLPFNMEIDSILENDLHIVMHLSDMSKKYVLTVENKTLLNIMKKYYLRYSKEKEFLSYKENFLNEFFFGKKITEAERAGYNSTAYNVGYIAYMPFENKENNEFVGTLSNYLSGFEDLFDVDFKLFAYDSIEELQLALSHGELDLVFGNFNASNTNVDKIYTSSPFKEEYVVLSKDTFVVNSIKSLADKEVSIVKNSYIYNYVLSNSIKFNAYNNTDELLRNISNSSVIIVDKDTYAYYQDKKLGSYKVIFTGILPYEYRFVIRDVDKNELFAEMFNSYVSMVNYEEIRFAYNTNSNISDFNILNIFITLITVIILGSALTLFIMHRKKKASLLKNNDKLKYIDAMTSLKNRAYLNRKIKEWDDNIIYPQAFVIVDLNNIKDINDSHGHEEGDMVIKKAASILIVNQEANTDIVRTDGNEFLVYMVGYDEKKVVAYTRMIYKELKELPYGYGAAIGYSMIMDDIKTVDDAINEATLDMRNKKENS